MANKNFINYLLNPKNWWLPLLVIFTISIAGVTMIGIHTYTEAPPIPDFDSQKGEVVFSKEDILKGQSVFQKYALMEYGTMFGDGALRGPDYTAEALHHISQYMNDYYLSKLKNDANSALLEKGVGEQVKSEIKTNRFNINDNSVSLTDAQLFGAGSW
jgi:nitric oxide reductase subunit B